MTVRVGFGFDVHEFTKERPLILGGVNIPHSHGLAGHSDADAVIHALVDALLGAAALDDIGHHFPDSDPQYSNQDSRVFLRAVHKQLREREISISNIDVTIVAQAPRMKPYAPQMKDNIATDLEISRAQVNIKATTTESLGFIGRREGVAVWAIVSVNQSEV